MSPPWFFENNSRKERRIAAKLSVPSQINLPHTLKLFTLYYVRSRSYVVICQVMFKRNRILACFRALDFEIYGIWVRFLAFWSVPLRCM